MSTQLPDNIRMLEKEELDMATLRVAIMAEFECINTYEQILTLLPEGELKTALIRIMEEDKAHARELQNKLSQKDTVQKTQAPEMPDIEDDSFASY